MPGFALAEYFTVFLFWICVCIKDLFISRKRIFQNQDIPVRPQWWGRGGTPHPVNFWPKYPVSLNFLLDIFLLDIPFYLIWISYISLIPRYPVSYTYFTQISHIPKTPWKGLTGLSFPFKYSFYYFRRERKLRIVTLSDGVVGQGERQT